MTKAFFLYLSRSPWARKVIMGLPFAKRAARRFVVGETLEEALRAVAELNRQGMLATLDQLGEDVLSPEEARNGPRPTPRISTLYASSSRRPWSFSQRDVRENTSRGPMTSSIWMPG